jgi:hypothetical protein
MNIALIDANDVAMLPGDRFIILAIDPGVTGAIAFYAPERPEMIWVYDMPLVDGRVNALELRVMIERFKPSVALIEQVGPMPRDGVRQAWRFSAAFTTAHVVCSLSGIPIAMVTPKKWKQAMGLRGERDGKEYSRKRVIETFPKCAQYFSRKKDQSRAEAALLAVYASKGFVIPAIKDNIYEQ